MFKDLTRQELENRIAKLFKALTKAGSDWDTAFVINKINQYYLTGTMQDGIFILKKDGSYAYFARRSFERAKMESPLKNIYPMESYRDAANSIGVKCGKTYIETEIVTLGIMERLKKYFNIEEIKPLDKILFEIRSVKSPYELYWIEESGRQHQYLLENIVPSMLTEGMSEADFTAQLYEKMINLGYHGVSRFSIFQTEMVVGQIGFGESSLYPTSFDGPGGMLGMCPAVPIIGNRERRLKKGDLVFVDIGYGVNGYHSDKTQVYMFGAVPSDEVVNAHVTCKEIQQKAASLLKPGLIPSEIYNTVMSEIDGSFLENFMGFGSRRVKFLGHGVGLHIDEYPVIANGFNEPLEENMVISLEPKKGIDGVGMVGVEDTYIVTSNGGRCVTGGGKDIFVVGQE
jgi:Xaa-Pro dipeptidase